MLSAGNRLRSAEEFRATIRRGRRCGGPLLVCHFVTGETGDVPRIGFIVSKAVGNAVVRNLVKRRLRHLVRERVASLPPAGMLVVRALPAAASSSYAELGAELDRCLLRVALR